ncbi:MAG: class I SAM-dependent methyltransferase [Lachnospiraceae bacterium]
MEQKNYWNLVSNTKIFTTPFQTNIFSSYVTKDSVILDIGCGYGRTLNELYSLGYKHLSGLDFSSGMIQRGKVMYPNLDLRLKNNDSIDIMDNSVDAVILFAVLTCIVSNTEQEKLIAEIHRILKPDGILYINDFLLNTDERNIKRYQQYQEQYGIYGVFELPEGAVLRHHDEKWLHCLLAGFAQLEYQHLTFTTMNGHTSNGFYYFGKKIEGKHK